MFGSKLFLAAMTVLVLGTVAFFAGCSPDHQDVMLPDTAKEDLNGEREDGTVEQHEKTIGREVPPVDQTVPGNLEIATFALG